MDRRKTRKQEKEQSLKGFLRTLTTLWDCGTARNFARASVTFGLAVISMALFLTYLQVQQACSQKILSNRYSHCDDHTPHALSATPTLPPTPTHLVVTLHRRARARAPQEGREAQLVETERKGRNAVYIRRNLLV